jgi:hypothetical protein
MYIYIFLVDFFFRFFLPKILYAFCLFLYARYIPRPYHASDADTILAFPQRVWVKQRELLSEYLMPCQRFESVTPEYKTKALSLETEQIGLGITFLACIRKFLGFNLGSYTGYPDLRFLLSSWVPPCKFQNIMSIKRLAHPSKSFPIHLSSYRQKLYSFDTENIVK